MSFLLLEHRFSTFLFKNVTSTLSLFYFSGGNIYRMLNLLIGSLYLSILVFLRLLFNIHPGRLSVTTFGLNFYFSSHNFNL